MYAPCCGVLMQNSTKPYDEVGRYEFIAKTKEMNVTYDSSMPVWKCPKCKLLWAIERMTVG